MRTFACALVLAIAAGGDATAHPDQSSADYVGCIETLPPVPPSELISTTGIGIRNKCSFSVVAVICTIDKWSDKSRFDHPINLPSGDSYFWSLYDTSDIVGLDSFACKPSARCFAGAEAHDPHCF